MQRYKVATLAMFLLAAGGCSHIAEQRLLSRLKDNPAPDFELRDLQGNTVRLSDSRGNPTVVNFFGYG